MFQLSKWSSVGVLNSLPKLRTVALEFNWGIYSHTPEYRQKVLEMLPKVCHLTELSLVHGLIEHNTMNCSEQMRERDDLRREIV